MPFRIPEKDIDETIRDFPGDLEEVHQIVTSLPLRFAQGCGSPSQ
jgi:hypothetical protein